LYFKQNGQRLEHFELAHVSIEMDEMMLEIVIFLSQCATGMYVMVHRAPHFVSTPRTHSPVASKSTQN
jgi:hypothetical protein